ADDALMAGSERFRTRHPRAAEAFLEQDRRHRSGRDGAQRGDQVGGQHETLAVGRPMPPPLRGAGRDDKARGPRGRSADAGGKFQSHSGATDTLTSRPLGRARLPISAISSGVSTKSKIAQFSDSRSTFDVRGMTM